MELRARSTALLACVAVALSASTPLHGLTEDRTLEHRLAAYECLRRHGRNCAPDFFGSSNQERERGKTPAEIEGSKTHGEAFALPDMYQQMRCWDNALRLRDHLLASGTPDEKADMRNRLFLAYLHKPSPHSRARFMAFRRDAEMRRVLNGLTPAQKDTFGKDPMFQKKDPDKAEHAKFALGHVLLTYQSDDHGMLVYDLDSGPTHWGKPIDEFANAVHVASDEPTPNDSAPAVVWNFFANPADEGKVEPWEPVQANAKALYVVTYHVQRADAGKFAGKFTHIKGKTFGGTEEVEVNGAAMGKKLAKLRKKGKHLTTAEQFKATDDQEDVFDKCECNE